MKIYYKQILEAINKGILIALDDYQDIELSNSISQYNDVINSEENIKKLIELNKYTVDLGLPSGNIWSKYNLGVNSKMLNTPLDYIGNYYAWGETETKRKYIPDNYKFGKIDFWTGKKSDMDMSKYNNSSDWLYELEDVDDVAKKILGSNWCIPSVKDYKELMEYTKLKFVVDYNGIKDLHGVIFIGSNKNSIFVPLSGEWDDVRGGRIGKHIINERYGYFWLSELDYKRSYENIACKASVCNAGQCINYTDRYIGLPIRPIYKYDKKILESISKSIHIALDDFDFNDNVKSTYNTNYSDVINIENNQLFTHLVKLINNIEVNNTINIEPSIKKEIRKLYKQLKKYLNGEKYIANSRDELKLLIKHIVILNPKEDLNWIDTSRITSMYALFDDFFSKNFCGDVSEWNMSNVTNTRNMFYRCEKFNCDVSKWDVSNVKVMGSMFGQCHKFNLDLSKWNVKNSTEMSCMFAGCWEFNSDISSWDVSNVTDMGWMFCTCKNFDLDLSNWDVSNVTNNNGFYYKAKFANYPEKVPNFDINKTMGNA